MHILIYAKDELKENSRGKAMQLFGSSRCSFEKPDDDEEPTLSIVAEEEDLIGNTDYGPTRSTKLIQRTVTVNLDAADLNSLLDCVAKNGAHYVDEAIAFRLCIALLKTLSKAKSRKHR